MLKCPKCEGHNVKVDYIGVGTQIYWADRVAFQSQFCRNDTYYTSDKVKTEHLVYTCLNCGYKVAEPTKDREG